MTNVKNGEGTVHSLYLNASRYLQKSSVQAPTSSMLFSTHAMRNSTSAVWLLVTLVSAAENQIAQPNQYGITHQTGCRHPQAENTTGNATAVRASQVLL
ncbi:hypothetical protein PCASD_15642 [Puccinia coronata f. sp. avenae]|uniref:Uncharacterized protein n=1 Tax=Puccinia coronata f. sp. avenae TaxID=200324 RepID=A0A2N5U1X2_9BASI|nr:hypothetical protein PCASD_15642 [Puccinia coronata f. sp. avenae]